MNNSPVSIEDMAIGAQTAKSACYSKFQLWVVLATALGVRPAAAIRYHLKIRGHLHSLDIRSLIRNIPEYPGSGTSFREFTMLRKRAPANR